MYEHTPDAELWTCSACGAVVNGNKRWRHNEHHEALWPHDRTSRGHSIPTPDVKVELRETP